MVRLRDVAGVWWLVGAGLVWVAACALLLVNLG